jgi:hypothetical protein
MKKRWFLFFSVISLLSLNSLAQTKIEVQKCNNGEITIRPIKECPVNSDTITATKKALRYANFWNKAIQNPGDTIPVADTKTKFVKATAVFYCLTQTEVSQGIVLKNKIIDVTGQYVVNKKEGLNYFIIFMVISLLLMIISDIVISKNFTVVAFVAALFAAFALFVAAAAAFRFALFAIFVAVDFAALAAAAIVFAFAVFGEDTYKKMYKIASTIYYILVVIAVVVNYL